MVMKRRMTAIEFETLRPWLRISDERVEAARLALVDGLTLQAVGDRFGWSRQAVGDSVRVVWAALESHHASQRAAAQAEGKLPPGWEQVTLVAPSELVRRFRREVAEVAASSGGDEESKKRPVAVRRRAQVSK